MNKLRRQDPPRSKSGSPTKPSTVVNPISYVEDAVEPMQPLTAVEQLWAARALKAEALLKAQQTHHRELRSMSYSQEIKRGRELESLMQQHKEKNEQLEKLVTVLATMLVALVVVIIYLATHHTRHASRVQRHWLLGLPSHFTIPILSPFTSVVEKETSVFGTRAIAVITLVLGALAYMVFRHWFNSTRVRLEEQPSQNTFL